MPLCVCECDGWVTESQFTTKLIKMEEEEEKRRGREKSFYVGFGKHAQAGGTGCCGHEVHPPPILESPLSGTHPATYLGKCVLGSSSATSSEYMKCGCWQFLLIILS